ncbi:MAG: DUF819 family protein [Halobacteriovoraceae bacterium]|jgi:uncharacterized membrane protein|nr:DUF819 family protein [Halobacteriovoraceae bacterium]MBT5093920.1 DUF819 family protein [Halobacteriovoraceae bacterium]
MIGILLFHLTIPGLVLFLEKRFKFIAAIGSVLICYALGMILNPISYFQGHSEVSKSLSQVMVIIAVPLMLFPLDLRGWLKDARTTVLSFCLTTSCVVISTLTIPYFFFSDQLGCWQWAGMLTGVYTGGTPNMSAISLALNADHGLFLSLNSADMLMSTIYIIFMLSIGPKLIALFLPNYDKGNSKSDGLAVEINGCRKSWRDGFIALILALLICLIAYYVNLAFFEKLSVPFYFLLITALAIFASSRKKIRALKNSYFLGEYLLLVFCLSIGTLVDFSSVMQMAPSIFKFTAFVFLLAVSLFFTMAYVFKIDRDTAIITNVAGIFGPALVAPVAKALNNPQLIPSGLSAGLVGYAVGNYLGLFVAYLLRHSLS